MRVSTEQFKAYFDYAMEFLPSERAKAEEYSAWLPPKIIDAHAHSNLPEHVGELLPKTYNHMMSTFPSFTIEQSRTLNRIFYPGIIVRSLRFPHVYKGINHIAANEYLLNNQTEGDRAAVFGLPENIPYTTNLLGDLRVAALKMYPAYIEPSATHVYDYFKPDILQVAEEKNVPIILHPPKSIAETAPQIVQLQHDFPRLKIAVAHLGLSKFPVPGLQEAFETLANETDVSMDTALNPSVDVHYMAISTLGIGRIMFGTDQPLDLLRTVPYFHPEKGERVSTEFPYHWHDKAEHTAYKHLSKGALHSHWLCLDALRGALSKLTEDVQYEAKQKILHDNAAAFYGFTE